MTFGMWDIYEWYLIHHRGAVLRGMWGTFSGICYIIVEQYWEEPPTPGVAQYDLDHCYMEGITDLGYMGHLWVVFATSLRSSTERHGDFSESVVFHFLTRCPCWFLGFWLWWFGVAVFLFGVFFGDTYISVSLIFSYVGMDNLNKRIDDRQSFKRARHRREKQQQQQYHRRLASSSWIHLADYGWIEEIWLVLPLELRHTCQ